MCSPRCHRSGEARLGRSFYTDLAVFRRGDIVPRRPDSNSLTPTRNRFTLKHAMTVSAEVRVVIIHVFKRPLSILLLDVASLAFLPRNSTIC